MYSLMVVLIAARDRRLRARLRVRQPPLPARFRVLLALMLYTHSWGLFVTFGLAVAFGVPCWYVSEDRSALLEGRACSASGSRCCSTCRGSRRCSTRSSTRARRGSTRRASARRSSSPSRCSAAAPRPWRCVLAGGLRPRRRAGSARVDDKERTRADRAAPSSCSARSRSPGSCRRSSPAWTTRYLGVSLGPMILLAALGLARAGNLGLVALAIVLGDLGDPAHLRPGEQEQRRRPRQRRVRSCARGRPRRRAAARADARWSSTTSRTSEARPTWARDPLGKVENDRDHGLARRHGPAWRTPRPREPRPLLATLPSGGRVCSCTRSPRARPLGRAVDGAREAALGPVGRGDGGGPAASSASQAVPALLPPGHADRNTRRALREDEHDRMNDNNDTRSHSTPEEPRAPEMREKPTRDPRRRARPG